ncbi:benzoate/H(+) symporter BenE family transporter [Aquabacterium sp. OR-4]|uniref:benzoate/H(+) symporter BenE family transporter n=1 Tax=Aquabacterium sp. OR-4 TaxID=2978127 RepID=UPI0021B2B189|nr:benzoate/H(+) symporter BenE family transporter [Aquabacterium sp. OR-4]MDT7837797.1 benzoate/H(+) symporter BenE family transporter [Aquabacterium sp. OR-4]
MRRFLSDLSLPAVVAGFVAVLVGYTSSVAIVFQAAQALGASAAQTASWMWALGLAMGISCVGLSLRWRMPVLTAWCTPGAALLAATQGVGLAEATGAFIVCALLIILAGVSGLFERVMDKVPMAVAAALLAGVLTRFGLDAVLAVRSSPALVLVMAGAFLAGRRWWPRYAVPGVLLAGVVLAALQGRLDGAALGAALHGAWATPVWVTPQFNPATLVGVALPLFIVTMASQNLPGVAAQRAAGYAVPVSPVTTATGLVTLVLAPFGCFAINLAAITAAICMSPEAHADAAKRYTAPVVAGIFYTLLGLAGGAVAGLFAAFPRELVAAVAGLALLGTIAGGLAAALRDERHRDAAAMTFLVTLSGVSMAGIGAAFWGVVAGAVTMAVQHWKPAR